MQTHRHPCPLFSHHLPSPTSALLLQFPLHSHLPLFPLLAPLFLLHLAHPPCFPAPQHLLHHQCRLSSLTQTSQRQSSWSSSNLGHPPPWPPLSCMCFLTQVSFFPPISLFMGLHLPLSCRVPSPSFSLCGAPPPPPLHSSPLHSTPHMLHLCISSIFFSLLPLSIFFPFLSNVAHSMPSLTLTQSGALCCHPPSPMPPPEADNVVLDAHTIANHPLVACVLKEGWTVHIPLTVLSNKKCQAAL